MQKKRKRISNGLNVAALSDCSENNELMSGQAKTNHFCPDPTLHGAEWEEGRNQKDQILRPEHEDAELTTETEIHSRHNTLSECCGGQVKDDGFYKTRLANTLVDWTATSTDFLECGPKIDCLHGKDNHHPLH
eukprot:2420973-Amphidinium_carterae.4